MTAETSSSQSGKGEGKDTAPGDRSVLAGKVALVTGATGYIGRAIALKLAREGATVAVNGRNQVSGEAVVAEIIANGGHAIFAHADITDHQQVNDMTDHAVAQLGRLDILVASGAGASRDSLPFRLFNEIDHNEIDYYIKTHWLTRAYAVQAASRHMVKFGGGKIVLIGTDAGRVATVGESMIGGSTAGMMQMSRALARELGRKNIRINVISMSYISDAEPRWQNSSAALEAGQDAEGKRTGMLENLRKRMLFDVTSEDIASTALFFASPASDSITGQTLSVNGGLSTPG
jgi:3-oxoacyl-[acyl-carrier protein] reductase